MIRRPPRSTRTDTLFPYTTLFRSVLPWMISSTSADFRRAVQRLISSSITALIDVSFARLHLSRFSLGHYRHGDSVAAIRAAPASRLLPADTTMHPRDTPRRRLWVTPSDAVARRYHRSEERRVGKECVSTCRSRGAPYH